jgi:Flp pilus assembly protein CpaB
VSSRARAVLFAAGALACGLLSAALAGSAAAPAEGGLDELRPVVISTATLERGSVIGRGDVHEVLDERRVPAAFAPPDALTLPPEALGRRLAVALPAGSYVTAASLTAGSSASPTPGPPPGSTPVEITVTGAAALEASRIGPGKRVDVVVSGQSGPGPATGRTYIAAEGVALLSLREARAETGVPGDRFLAVLAVNRAQALRLIRAEGVARSIRLLAG